MSKSNGAVPYAALYARVSIERAGKPDRVSISEQLADGRAYCDGKGYVIVAEYVDDKKYISSKSGRKVEPSATRTDRPGWLQMLGDAGQKWTVLVGWAQDRLARGLTATGMLLDEMKARRFSVELVKETFDLGLAGMRGAMSGIELDKIRDRTMSGREGRVKKGVHMGDIPYGARRLFDSASGELTGWEIDPAYQPFFDEFGKLFLSRLSMTDIAYRLGKKPETGKQWQDASLWYIIRNPFYRGKLAFGRKTRPDDEIVRAAASHAPAWDPATCAAIEQELARRSATWHGGPRRRRWEYLFSGLAFCGACGRMMIRTRTTVPDPAGEKYRGYGCNQPRLARTGYIADPPHENNYISERKLLARVTEFLSSLTPDDVDAYLAMLRERLPDNSQQDGQRIRLDVLIQEREELDSSLRLVRGAARSVLQVELDRIGREIESLERRLTVDAEPPDLERDRARMLELIGRDLAEFSYVELSHLFADSLLTLYVWRGELVVPPLLR